MDFHTQKESAKYALDGAQGLFLRPKKMQKRE